MTTPDGTDADASSQYTASSYGDAFAEVYDDWYGPSTSVASSDLASTIATLVELAGRGPVLELGVGTGRLALPLAAEGLAVHGVDASQKMLDQLRAKPGHDRVTTSHGDMASDLPPGPFSLIFVAINTFFNLTTLDDQRRCLRAVAQRLSPHGRFVIEAFVPDSSVSGHDLSVRSVHATGVTLMASYNDPAQQTVVGHIIDLRDGILPRLKPWRVRYATPDQLDALAASCGLERVERWANWSRESFSEFSTHHVSVYKTHAFRAL